MSTIPRRAAALLPVGRETARDHVRHALQLLMDRLLRGDSLNSAARRDVRAAVHRMWLALREIDRGNAQP